MHKIPALFQEIINHDSARPGKNVKVVEDIHEWRDRRKVLTDAAKRFVAKQRGSGGAA